MKLPGQNYECKLLKVPESDKREFEGFDMALPHKYQLGTYRESKEEVEEEYIEHVKRAPFRLFLNSRWGTYGLFEKTSRHAINDH